jgi:hypothetical protein
LLRQRSTTMPTATTANAVSSLAATRWRDFIPCWRRFGPHSTAAALWPGGLLLVPAMRYVLNRPGDTGDEAWAAWQRASHTRQEGQW